MALIFNIIINALLIASSLALQYGYSHSQRHFFEENPPSLPNPEYIMKDAILYLTPSQIRALEATGGLNKVVPLGKSKLSSNVRNDFSEQDLKNLDDELNKQLNRLNLNKRITHNRRPAPIEEPSTEKYVPFSPNFQATPRPKPQQQILPEQQITPEQELKYFAPEEQKLKLPESYMYIKFFTDEKPKANNYPHLENNDFQNEYEDTLTKNFDSRYKFVPYSYSPENSRTQSFQWSSYPSEQQGSEGDFRI